MSTSFKNVTLRERIHDEIARMILSGELPPGSLLDERELSERLSVSRTPFREALGTLATEGLIETKPYRGTIVRDFSPKQINDLYEVRKSLEGLAVRLAVPLLSVDEVDFIDKLLGQAIEALRQDDLVEYAALDRQFHEIFARVSGNETLQETLGRLSRQIQLCRVFANEDPNLAERTVLERAEVLAALRQKDANAAAALMEVHIAGVQRAVMRKLAMRQQGQGTTDGSQGAP